MLKVAGFDASFEWTFQDHPSFEFSWRPNKNEFIKTKSCHCERQRNETTHNVNLLHEINSLRHCTRQRCAVQHLPEAHGFFFHFPDIFIFLSYDQHALLSSRNTLHLLPFFWMGNIFNFEMVILHFEKWHSSCLISVFTAIFAHADWFNFLDL